MKNKKIIILKHNEGQLANQLWCFNHLLAYALEKNFDIDIWCFYQYAKFFNTPFPKNKFIKLIFYQTFPLWAFSSKNLFRIFRKLYRFFYKIFVVCPIKFFYSNKIADSSNTIFVLDDENKKPQIIKNFEIKENFNTLFTIDWNFHCFSYLIKHREKIKEIFKPKREILERVENYIFEIRKDFNYVIGLHLRVKEPGDNFGDDLNFFFHIENKDLDYISELIKEFIKIKNLNFSKTAILIASNHKNLDISKFGDLNIFFKPKNFVEDLFLLSKCDIILAPKSTFSFYASYLGNISFIYLYKDKNKFIQEIEKIK